MHPRVPWLVKKLYGHRFIKSMQKACAVSTALSSARMATYRSAAAAAGFGGEEALALYAWNARVSGALLTPLHICEVVVRNAVADALELIHGPSWPWSSGFERSLPRCAGPGYNPLTDLQRLKSKRSTAGQIVAELKFVFWEKMFTSRHDDRIWNSCLIQVFPNLEPANTTSENRKKIFENLNNVRLLRNRIAHHEPIFSRDLQADFCIIIGLVEARCRASASWMLKQQHALEVIATKPF
ncbi:MULTISPECIES: hypothetical protein [unclassified Pseudomonas]|uniref:hypothetical protein n=2 Tax=Pseudomonas TaxID=286 RepID=UPI001FD164F3|nr:MULTISPECIES: hypothetical protein [unclassified Pseudomonas]